MAEPIIPFTNPVMVGEFVNHCHIVGHDGQHLGAAEETLGEELWDRMTRFAGLELPSPWPLAQARESGQAFQTETSANICRPNSEEAPTTH